jgi:zinc protease
MGQLDNGMTYYIQHNEKPEDRVEIRLAVKTGSVMEDEDQLGLAHFVEHMAFNGTENFEKNELINFLETVGTRFGADLNAYTSFDETVYMLQLRTDDPEIMDKGMLVFEDWAGGLAFNHEEIDKERGVVVSEWRTRLSPGQRMQQEYLPILYKDSRYAQRLPIGDPEIIENADYDVVKRFYRDWYRPDLMAIIVVGDIDVDMMEKEIKERFSDLENPSNPRERKEYAVPQHKETLVSIVSDEEESFTRAAVTYKHPHAPTRTMDDYRNSVIRTLYNQMLNARLNEIGQEANPPFIFAFSGYGRDIGDIDAYSSSATTAEGEALRGLEAVLTENERVLRYGFTKGELERAKSELLVSAERRAKEKDKTASRSLAMRYVYNFLDENPIPGPEQNLALYEEMLPSIQLDDVNRLAEKWITDENRVVVITGPKKDEFPMPTEDDVRNLLNEIENKDLEPYVDDVSDAPLLAGELEEGKIVNDKEYKDVGVTEWELSNGVKVVLKPTDFKNDEILMRATSIGGHSNYDLETYPSASNATSIVSESGVGEFSATQLEKKLTGKTVYVNPYIGELYEGMNGGASPEDLETLFQLVYLYFTAPREDADAFQSFMTKQKAIYGNLMSNPNYYFLNETIKIKTNDHPRRGFPTVEDMEKVDLETAMSVYKDRFKDASDFTFIFVGNFDMPTMKKFSTMYLANLPTADRKDMWKDVGADYVQGKVDKSFSMGKAPKTQVDITFHGEAEWNMDTRYAMRSMVEALRIKLRESMREDKGGVYGVSVRGNISRIPKEEYSINISFNSDPEKTDELIQTAMADIQDVMKNGVDETYLTKVKETQRQTMVTDLKENRFWSSQLEFAYENDLDPNMIQMENLEKKIAALDSDMIKNAASQYFNFDNMIQIVMSPEEEMQVEP